mmetsp:Transcript_71133/g.143198  ORF Transcript_71133/g.143198 Transcript_71133/m.143198 type:complete len:91 (+) Transcript_71133:154-426(+)
MAAVAMLFFPPSVVAVVLLVAALNLAAWFVSLRLLQPTLQALRGTGVHGLVSAGESGGKRGPSFVAAHQTAVKICAPLSESLLTRHLRRQ